MNAKYYKAIYLMLGSGVCIALVALCGKHLSATFPILILIFLRFFIPCVILLWTQFTNQATVISLSKVRKEHFLRALFMLLAQSCFFICLKYSDLLMATLLLTTAPLFTPIIELITQPKKYSLKKWICLILGFIGVGIILNPSQSHINLFDLIGLASGFFVACSQISYHQNSKTSTPAETTFITYGICSITLILIIILFHQTINWHFISTQNLTPKVGILLLGLGLFSISNQIFRGRAYRMVNRVSSLMPFIYLAIIFSALFDWISIGTIPSINTIIGAIIIIGSVTYPVLTVKTSKRKTHESLTSRY